MRIFLILIVALVGGCSTQGEKMVESFSRTRQLLADAQGQVDMTLIRLKGVRSARGDSLGDAFREYKQEVARLEVTGKDSKRRADTMKEEADAHIKAWQSEMKDIKDPAIKSSLESRRQAVRSNFKLVQMYAQDARKEYEPFLEGNRQLVQALSIDLSPATITSLSPSMDRVAAEGQALKERITAMQRALDNIAAGVSPIGH